MGQSIATGDAAPARTIRYTLDLTRQYHNLLQKTGNGPDQTYFWDGNVAGMEEEGRDHFYFQDDLGSPMRLTDEAGRSEEAYGFDEFGNDIRTAKDIFQDSMQSFGFTGYQMDSAGGLYFAQARRYDAGAGRFVSEDFLKGHIAVPYTMNHYSYCWNRPMDLVDLNGKFPSWRDLKKFWNKYIYGEEYVISVSTVEVTGRDIGLGTYWGRTDDITKPSAQYTGSWIKKVTTTDGDDGISQSYSLNIPSIDLGKKNKFGIPTSLGVACSKDGVSLDANIGIDIGKLNVNIPISVGLNWDNLVSIDASLNGGWADNSYGLDLSAGLHPGSNLKVGVHSTKSNGIKTSTDKCGVYMRMGYVYVVVIAAAALVSMLYGNDPSSAGQTIINFINNFVNNGVCPALQ